MTPDQAAWIRATVWTPAMRKTYREVPGYYTHCACQSGLTSYCQLGQCGHCHRATGLPSYSTVICRRGGTHPARLPEHHAHPTPSATGAWTTATAMVWLADRVCRWVCPHDCHSAPAAPQQLDLFGAVA